MRNGKLVIKAAEHIKRVFLLSAVQTLVYRYK